jgi:hypothetical protein
VYAAAGGENDHGGGSSPMYRPVYAAAGGENDTLSASTRGGERGRGDGGGGGGGRGGGRGGGSGVARTRDGSVYDGFGADHESAAGVGGGNGIVRGARKPSTYAGFDNTSEDV